MVSTAGLLLSTTCTLHVLLLHIKQQQQQQQHYLKQRYYQQQQHHHYHPIDDYNTPTTSVLLRLLQILYVIPSTPPLQLRNFIRKNIIL